MKCGCDKKIVKEVEEGNIVLWIMLRIWLIKTCTPRVWMIPISSSEPVVKKD
jgi:hypothetical protein